MATILFALPNVGSAATYHISAQAPGGGNGSIERPWDSFPAALRSRALGEGDVVLVAPGNYGRIKFHDVHPGGLVTFRAAGDGVHATELEVHRSENLRFEGFQVWPRKFRDDNQSIVRAGHKTNNIHFSRFDVRSEVDAADYLDWSLRDWKKRRVSGFLINGRNASVTDTTLVGMSFGIATTGKNTVVENNTVFGFSGDAIRGLGDNTKIVRNHMKDCVKIDGNHDDGLQSWTHGDDGKVGGGIQYDLHIIGNIIEEWTANPNHPLICDLQGMLFGHRLRRLVITDNIVSVSAYHGISAAGVTSGLIANNTLVNSRGPNPKAPWIGILGGGKDVIIANNITPAFSIPDKLKSQIQSNRNVMLVYSARELVDPLNQDYRLKPGSGLRGSALAQYAPSEDINGKIRGASPDLGALQVSSP